MAVIGGHLAHPTPLQNSYCNGLVQPSLIMNHHIDCQEDVHPILATNISKLKIFRYIDLRQRASLKASSN